MKPGQTLLHDVCVGTGRTPGVKDDRTHYVVQENINGLLESSMISNNVISARYLQEGVRGVVLIDDKMWLAILSRCVFARLGS